MDHLNAHEYRVPISNHLLLPSKFRHYFLLKAIIINILVKVVLFMLIDLSGLAVAAL
jgi:hypothetical protein